MVLVELPVSFKDLKTMMEIFKKEDSTIDNCEVNVQGNLLVVNQQRNNDEPQKRR